MVIHQFLDLHSTSQSTFGWNSIFPLKSLNDKLVRIFNEPPIDVNQNHKSDKKSVAINICVIYEIYYTFSVMLLQLEGDTFFFHQIYWMDSGPYSTLEAVVYMPWHVLAPVLYHDIWAAQKNTNTDWLATPVPVNIPQVSWCRVFVFLGY